MRHTGHFLQAQPASLLHPGATREAEGAEASVTALPRKAQALLRKERALLMIPRPFEIASQFASTMTRRMTTFAPAKTLAHARSAILIQRLLLRGPSSHRLFKLARPARLCPRRPAPQMCDVAVAEFEETAGELLLSQ